MRDVTMKIAVSASFSFHLLSLLALLTFLYCLLLILL